MKQTGICPKCGSHAIGHLAHVVDWDSGVRHRKLAGGRVGQMSTFGEVEAYVCTTCGFFEEYVREPEKILWSTLDGFHWVKK